MPKSVLQQLIEASRPEAKSLSKNEKRETSNEKPAARTAAADRAARCMHVKSNGVRCKSPAMRNDPFCFFHDRFYNPPFDDSFPTLEDANSVQCAILQVLNGLKQKQITPLEARVYLYGLKAASINARRTNFDNPRVSETQITEMPADELARLHAAASHSASEGAQGFNPEKKESLAERTARSASPSTKEVVIPSPKAEGPAFRVEQDFSPAKESLAAQRTASSAATAASARSASPSTKDFGKAPSRAPGVQPMVAKAAN